MVTREAFTRAFLHGDVATIAAYFASDAGLAHMLETEHHFAELPSPRAFVPRLTGFVPWHYTPGPLGFSMLSLLDLAIECGHAEVVEWLFDGELVGQMSATLAAVFGDACKAAVGANDRVILDKLLSSRVFMDVVPDPEKQAILNSLLMSDREFTHATTLELLIAHGAVIESPATISDCACIGELEQVETLVRNGSFVVGYEVVSGAASKCKVETVRRLLALGADANGGSGVALYRAALQVHFPTVKTLLEDGFVDVGAESIYGHTALQAAARRGGRGAATMMVLGPANPKTSSFTQVRNILIEYGANPAHDRSRWG